MTRLLTPQLRINKKFLSLSAVREMSKMSGWIMVNDIGGLLYISVSFVLINLFLGPEHVGRFGVIAQIPVFISQLGGTLSNVFAPVAYDYIASNNIEALAIQIRRSTKFMVLLMAFPIGLVCGLAKPLLILWLGESFSDLNYLVWLLVGPWVITISIRPMFSIFRGLNKVKTPAIVTLIIGILNVLICIALMKFTDLGIYAVAFSLLLCLAGKHLFFTPIYAAIITGQSKIAFIKELLLGLVVWLLLSLAILALSVEFNLVSIPRVMGVSIISFLIYSGVCYLVFLSKEDRRVLWSLITRTRQKG
jgi:membrane protein EpsK